MQQIERLRYEARLAERQFNHVDPDNRLVAAELERRWETALCALRRAEEALARRASQIETQSYRLPPPPPGESSSSPSVSPSPNGGRAIRRSWRRPDGKKAAYRGGVRASTSPAKE